MFKKRPAINDLIKSIKTEAKEVKKESPANDVFTLKKDTTATNEGKVESLEGLMSNLLIQHQVKFSEALPEISAIGAELRKTFAAKTANVPKDTFKVGWQYGIREKAEKIFSYNSKQYFVAVQELRKK